MPSIVWHRYLFGHGDSLSVDECEDFVVIHYRVHALDPQRVHWPVKHNPLLIRLLIWVRPHREEVLVLLSHTRARAHTHKHTHAQNECEFPNTPWISLSLYFSFPLSLLLSVSLISLLWFHRHQRDLQAIVVKPLIDHLSFPVPLSAHVCLIYWTQNNKTQTLRTAHLSYTHTYKRALSGSSRPAGCLGKQITPDLSHTATGSATSPLGHLPSLNREEGTLATDTSCTEPLQTVCLHSKWYQKSIHTHISNNRLKG